MQIIFRDFQVKKNLNDKWKIKQEIKQNFCQFTSKRGKETKRQNEFKLENNIRTI